jgi:hypothetical protein
MRAVNSAEAWTRAFFYSNDLLSLIGIPAVAVEQRKRNAVMRRAGREMADEVRRRYDLAMFRV